MSKPIQSQLALKTVLDFMPPKIDRGVPDSAMHSYTQGRERGSDFRMSEIIKEQTGLSEIEEKNFEEEIERKTLEKLKVIQESAYQEAYQLGLEDGRKEAYQQHGDLIQQKMGEYEQVVESLLRIKTELLSQNERHLVELSFHLAKRLANHEISVNPEATLSLVRQAVEMAQNEEKLVVEVHPDHLEYLETLKSETGREFEFLKKIQLEPNESMGSGGCIVTSNYGEIDSRMDERVHQLWKALEEILPRLKVKVSAA